MNLIQITSILMTLCVLQGTGEESIDCSNDPRSFYFLSGHDKAGQPIWVYKMGNLGEHESVKLLVQRGIKAYGAHLMEDFEAKIDASIAEANKNHPGVSKFVYIMDASRISPADILMKLPLLIKVYQIFTEKLESKMAYGFVPHSGFFARQIMANLKTVDPTVLNRLTVSGGAPNFESQIAKDQLPANLGGDANHKCLGHYEPPQV